MTDQMKKEIRERAKTQTYDELEKWEFYINMTDRFTRDDFEVLDIIREEKKSRKEG